MQYSALLLLVIVIGALMWISMPVIKYKTLAVLLYVTFSVGLFASHTEFSGKPRPHYTEWRQVRGTIIGFHLSKADNKMWVWVLSNGLPTAYEFPYPEKSEAEALNKKWKNREYTGDSLYLGEDGKVEAKQGTPMPPKE